MVFYIYKMKDLNYIGSCVDIKKRTKYHKTKCWNKKSDRYNLLVYKFIREKNKNIELEILFCYKDECSNKIQKLMEQFYINKYDSKNNGLNSYNAFSNNKKYKKKWYEKNKDKTKKRSKEYYEKNKDKIRKRNKKYHKTYREKNRDKLRKKNKEYREKNKEFTKRKINCPICKCSIRKDGLKRHQKTDKCLKAKNLMFKFF